MAGEAEAVAGVGKAMNEANFSTQVEDLLERFSWQWCHFRPARTGRTYIDKDGNEKEVWNTPLSGDPGFPDYMAVREEQGGFAEKSNRLLFIELKGDGGEVTPEQQKWLNLLYGVDSAEVMVWWPEKPGLEAMVEILR